MPGDTYVNAISGDPESLSMFADQIFRVLNVSTYSRHESDNYAEGEYFVGRTLGIKIEICLADDCHFSEYRFWITFWADGTPLADKSVFEGLADLIARVLTLNGYQVARDPTSGRTGGEKLIYSRTFDADTSGGVLIEVKHVAIE